MIPVASNSCVSIVLCACAHVYDLMVFFHFRDVNNIEKPPYNVQSGAVSECALLIMFWNTSQRQAFTYEDASISISSIEMLRTVLALERSLVRQTCKCILCGAKTTIEHSCAARIATTTYITNYHTTDRTRSPTKYPRSSFYLVFSFTLIHSGHTIAFLHCA